MVTRVADRDGTPGNNKRIGWCQFLYPITHAQQIAALAAGAAAIPPKNLWQITQGLLVTELQRVVLVDAVETNLIDCTPHVIGAVGMQGAVPTSE